jgi:hypothetical protein
MKRTEETPDVNANESEEPTLPASETDETPEEHSLIADPGLDRIEDGQITRFVIDASRSARTARPAPGSS